MGIQGLLPFLKKIHSSVNIAQFEGCTVAIDAYCWLHKGAFACADKLAMGEPTDQYVYYCMKYLNYMLKKDLKPIMVFDGGHLPSKKEVEKTRRERRNLYKKKAAQFLREGKRAEARECLQRCIDVTPQMALELMKACRARGVDCIVAPYEADAQLAYLNKAGIAQIIVTEDSDLLLFGCDKVLFKMDFFGNGTLIESRRLNEVMEIQNGFYTFEKFRFMCILSGCDYLPSLPGIGLTKACKVFKLTRQSDIRLMLKKLSVYIKLSQSVVVSDEYIDGFIQANNTFLYQLSFDPKRRQLVPLNPYEDDVHPEDVVYAGPYIPNSKAYQIALGNLDLFSKEKLFNFDPDVDSSVQLKSRYNGQLHWLSIWNKNYRPRPKTLHSAEHTPDRPSLKGKESSLDIKSLRRTSSIKRAREVDDSLDTRSDGDLTNLYSFDGHDRKRPKTEPKATTQSSEDDVKDLDHGSVDDMLDEISANDQQVKEEPPNESETGNPIRDEEKENSNVVTMRNKFAISSAQKRPRFDINATKVEVKSRFFAKSKSTFLDSLMKDEKCVSPLKDSTNTDCQDLCDVNDLSRANDIENETCDNSLSQSSIKSNHKSVNESPINSPKSSVFSWSQSYSRKQNIVRTPLSTSKLASGQFKPVLCRDSSDSPKSPSDDVITEKSEYFLGKTACSEPQRVETGGILLIADDDDDMPNSKEVDVSMKSSCRLPSLQEDIGRFDIVLEEPINESKPTQNRDAFSQKSQEKTPNASIKKQCRMTGLAKSSRKGKSGAKKDLSQGRQNNIKDMFSKFSHSNRASSKFQHSEDVGDQHGDLTLTPESTSNYSMKSNSTQRKLL